MKNIVLITFFAANALFLAIGANAAIDCKKDCKKKVSVELYRGLFNIVNQYKETNPAPNNLINDLASNLVPQVNSLPNNQCLICTDKKFWKPGFKAFKKETDKVAKVKGKKMDKAMRKALKESLRADYQDLLKQLKNAWTTQPKS